MANRFRRHLTPRDLDVLSALDRTPLTVQQLHKLSETFAEPFPNERRVQERMAKLAAAGWVHQRWYGVASRGSPPAYFQLTLAGFQQVHGAEITPPRKRCFAEVRVAHHHHTRRLADFIVHTFVAARRAGIEIARFAPENFVRLPVARESLLPDCSFTLSTSTGEAFNFVVELDNATERIRSRLDLDSWQRKIRLYDQHEDTAEDRRRVLIVGTRSRERIGNILQLARDSVRNRQRSLFLGIHLEDYLAQRFAFTVPCFADHRGQTVALLPTKRPIKQSAKSLVSTVGAC